MFIFGTAEDVFTMAVRVEENGHAFYSGAAQAFSDENIKELFTQLAAMENSHIYAFKALRGALPDFGSDMVWDPAGLAESYLQATADTHIFTLEAAEERLKRVKTPIEGLDMAIQFEKDSVAFFLGMKEVLPDEASKGEIDKLIRSEMQHVNMLNAAKKRVLEGKSAAIA